MCSEIVQVCDGTCDAHNTVSLHFICRCNMYSCNECMWVGCVGNLSLLLIFLQSLPLSSLPAMAAMSSMTAMDLSSS